MSLPMLALAMILVIGAIYVMLPVALGAYVHFSKPIKVICPKTHEAALITLNARRAAFASAIGRTKLDVTGCSRWPQDSGCGRECASQVEHSGWMDVI
jgi:hypothetical protein